MKSLYPLGDDTKVSNSKAKLCSGNSTTLEDLAKRLYTRKEDEFGREKQRRPWDTERRCGPEGAHDSRGETESGKVRQVLRIVS